MVDKPRAKSARAEPDDDSFVITMYASLPEGMRFSPEAAQSLVGRTSAIGIGLDEPEYTGTVLEAHVINDGEYVEMAVKLENMPPELADFVRDTSFMH